MAENETTWGDLRAWLRRKHEVERALQELEEQEARLAEELEKVEEQAAYYDSLAKDMKRAVDPPKLSGLLRSWRRS